MAARTPVFTIMVLYGAGLGAAGQFAKLSVPFEALTSSYPTAGAAVGFAVSIISFLGILFGLFTGLLVSRLGYRRMLILSLFAGAALAPAQAALPDLPFLIGLRFLEGIPHLVIVVAAPTLMAELTPERWKGAVMTIWSTFFGVSFAVVALIPATLPQLILGHGAWMAAMGLLLWVLLPQRVRRRDLAPLSIRQILTDHVAAYRSPRTSAPGLGWLFYTLTYVALLTVLPSQLGPEDQDWVGLVLPIAGLAVSLTIGIALLSYFRAVTLVILGFLMGVCGALLLILAPQNPWLAVALMASLGLVQSGSFAAVPQLNEGSEEQARANGAMAQMGNLGNALGTPLLLILVAWGGATAVYLGLVAAYLCGVGTHVMQATRRSGQKTA